MYQIVISLGSYSNYITVLRFKRMWSCEKLKLFLVWKFEARVVEDDESRTDWNGAEDHDEDEAGLDDESRKENPEELPPDLIPFWIESLYFLSKLHEPRDWLHPRVGCQRCKRESPAILSSFTD